MAVQGKAGAMADGSAKGASAKDLVAVIDEISELTADATQRVVALRHDLESFSGDDKRALRDERKHMSRLKQKMLG